MLPAGHYVPMDPLVTTTQISIYDDDYDFYADVTDGPGPYDHYDHEDDSTWTVLLYPETTSRCVRERMVLIILLITTYSAILRSAWHKTGQEKTLCVGLKIPS